MKINLKRQEKGFTIIEVIIVLAIAGLILAIVFLAVPALQRGQRNNARKQEASRVASAVLEFGSNTGTAGTLPATANDCQSVVNLTSNLKQFTFTPSASCPTAVTTIPAAASVVDNSLYIVNATAPATAPSTLGSSFAVMFLVNNSSCNGSSATTYSASSNKAALLYSLEGSSNAAFACTNVQ